MQKKIVHRDNYKIFNINTLHMTLNGHAGEFYQIDAPDWVNIIAMHDDHILLVRQYRIGIDDITLEFPAGIIEGYESPVITAERELREETGFTGRGQVIGTMHANPAIMTNQCTTVLIDHARRTHHPEPDVHEQIELVMMTLPEIEAAVTSGQITHALHIASLYQLKAHLS